MKVPRNVQLPSVHMQDMDDFVLLLVKDVQWTKILSSVDSRLFEERGTYCGELVDVKVTVQWTHFDVVKLLQGALSANTDLFICLGQAEYRTQVTPTVCEATDAYLISFIATVDQVIDHCMRQAVSDTSIQQFNAELIVIEA